MLTTRTASAAGGPSNPASVLAARAARSISAAGSRASSRESARWLYWPTPTMTGVRGSSVTPPDCTNPGLDVTIRPVHSTGDGTYRNRVRPCRVRPQVAPRHLPHGPGPRGRRSRHALDRVGRLPRDLCGCRPCRRRRRRRLGHRPGRQRPGRATRCQQGPRRARRAVQLPVHRPNGACSTTTRTCCRWVGEWSVSGSPKRS